MASGKTLQSTIEIAGVLSPSLQAAIRDAVSKLEKMSQETLDQVGAAEKLSAEISAQESVLKSLRKGYADYVVSGKESSEEAETLSDKIEELSKELEDNQDTLAAAEKAAKRLGKRQDDTADAYTRLERTISDQEDDLEKLRREYANVVLEQGKTSKEAKTLEGKIGSLSAELNKNKQKLKDVGDAADYAGDKAESSADGYTVLKDVIADLATEAIQSAIDGFKELALEGDSAIGKLAARTGASASEMEGFEDIMYEVYNANYGESLDEVSETLSTVIQMTDDLDNASLAQITKNTLALSDIFGFDTAESMRAVNSLMDQFGVTSEEAFNLIVQGAQNGLNQNDDLLDTINEYSVQFESAGFSAEEMFNMLANGVEAGTWSVDKLGDAVKEYNIRMKDGTATDALMENYKALGMTRKEANALAEAFGEGGEAGSAAMKQTLDAILAVEDENQRYQLGVAMFGTMWEDLGEDAVKALFDTEGAIKSANDAMAQADAAAYDNLKSSLSQLGRTIKAEVLQPIAAKLTPVVKRAVDFVESKVGPTVDYLTDKMPVLGAALGAVGAVIAGIKIAGFVKKLGSMVGLLKGGLGNMFGGKGGLGGDSSGGIFGTFSRLANTKVTTVLKGIANLSIILISLGALAALAAWVAPSITSLCDSGQFLKLLAAIALVGLMGTAMAKLAGIVGKIPVAKVAKGLANIAIVMVGFGALAAVIAWVAPYITDLCDSGTFLELLAAIGAVGLVGAALAGLAGLIGMIPIPVIAMGMAGIAIALAGFTGIIAAFGALSKIKGFDEFISTGGALLTEICGIIGEMAGSIIGGFGEGLTASLPTIGQNLADFATNIEPMFAVFSGVDTSGIGGFAAGLGALLLALTADSVFSFFTGGIDYTKLATDLNTFASNLGGFFGSVSGIDEGAFSKASGLFECLAGIKSLPKEGGVVGWFQGEVDFTKITTGLQQLGSSGMIIALKAVQNIPEEGFTALSRMFETLSGIKSLEKDGGVVGWFQGEVDYTKMVAGIQQLASAGMVIALKAIANMPEEGFTALSRMFEVLSGIKSLEKDGGVVGWFTGEVDFTKMVAGVQQLGSAGMVIALKAIAGIPAEGFTSLGTMFDTLAGIKGMPRSGGVAQWFAGDASTGLTNIASALPGVASNVASFFTNLNGITDFSPIKNLFTSIGDIDIDADAAKKGFLGLGSSDLESLGTGLSNFATNAAAFFTSVQSVSADALSGYFTALGEGGSLPEKLAGLDGTVGTTLSTIATTTETKMKEIRDAINIDTSEESVSKSLGTIDSDMSSKLSSALTKASTKFQEIFKAIKSKMDEAKNAVTSALNAMKNAFSNASWSLPKIKLPHLKVTGDWSFNPPKVPSFSVSWYKDGGILTQPTVFGAAGNTLLAGGEAGAEAVLPLKLLWEKMETLLRAVLNSETSTGAPPEVGLTATAGKLLTLDDFSLGSLANNSSVVVYYDFSGFTWSPQIQTGDTGDNEDNFMAKLRAHEAEFFDWLEEFIKMREVAQYA